MANFLPTLAPSDIEQAAKLIQQAYSPQAHLSSEDQRRLQQELFDVQKRFEAWGLVIPFLEHSDPNVQFFGAHTVQVKIARDWASFPQESVLQLRDMVVDLTGHSLVARRNKVILRKLFVAVTSLALKLCPQTPSQWPDWLLNCVQTWSALGAPTEYLLDFLEIVAQEVEVADLLPTNKPQMQQTLLDAVPMVIGAITSCISRPRPHPSSSELKSALKCLEAWMYILPANDITPVIPHLISLLTPIRPLGEIEEEEFIPASDALQEIMSRSALSDGAGSKTLTEPLLLWFEHHGGKIVEQTLNVGFADSVSRSFCKLLTALGDHSTQYLASNLASRAPPTPAAAQIGATIPSKSHLVHTFLKLTLAYTALPGFYGIDEEESEMTLGFWYLFQEALWTVDYEADESTDQFENTEAAQWDVAKAVYSELVQVLRRKVVWPAPNVLQSWTRDQKDKFQAYRRDVGDTLINAYYVLRDDTLAYYVNDLAERLSGPPPHAIEEIEGTLHCIKAVQEAIPIEDNPHLSRLFGPEILGRLPTAGSDLARRTAVVVMGTYASWFTVQPTQPPGSPTPSLLMNAISYVVAALTEPNLCLLAANALRDLCDANRAALAPHIGAFGELHSGLTDIPDTEKSKVLQSIASVIQALPAEEEIPPIEAIVSPVVAKLFEALHSSAQLPDEARAVAIQQLFTISGVARGLTRTIDSLLIFDDSPAVQEEAARMKRARADPRMVRLREGILDAVRRTVDLWSTDVSVSDALSDLFKAITSLPSDVTLLSLPPGPLLELVCLASQRQLTAVWLSLATMLVIQLDPPSLLPATFKSLPDADGQGIVLNALAMLLQSSLNMFGQAGAMEANPDIVQAFFNCMDTIAHHFIHVFYQLPPNLLNTLIRCSIGALALQERYSLVSACTFLGSFVNRTATTDELSEARKMLVQTHGRPIMRALLSGFAAVAPRSATPNLIELLSTLVTRFPAESKAWMAEILYSEDFTPSKATNEAKDKFVKTLFGSRSMKRTRDAAQQFTLVARGLEGSSFGYATVTM